MALLLSPHEQAVERVIKLISDFFADKEDIVRSTGREGITFRTIDGHRYLLLSSSKINRGSWELKCEQTNEDWTRIVDTEVHHTRLDVIPGIIYQWFFGEGVLFNVPPVGQRPGYQACRTEGRTHRLPIRFPYQKEDHVKKEEQSA